MLLKIHQFHCAAAVLVLTATATVALSNSVKGSTKNSNSQFNTQGIVEHFLAFANATAPEITARASELAKSWSRKRTTFSSDANSANSASTAQSRQGWGWSSGGGGGKGGMGDSTLTLATFLGLLALYGTGFAISQRNQNRTTIIVQSGKRKRRAVDDIFDSDFPLEGDGWAELMSRVGEYFGKTWGAEDYPKNRNDGASKMEPFNLR